MRKQNKIQVIGIFASIALFGLTLITPAQYHIEFVYSLIVLLTIWTPGNRSTFDVSVVMSVLIMIGYFLNHNLEYSNDNLPSFILPILFIWAFTFAIIKYKQSQENLIRSTENLNAMFTHATEGIIISNVKGEIVMANPRSCEQFGYERGKLQGMLIEDLIPKKFVHKHADHRKGYYKELHNRSMGQGMNLFAKKKDGEEFPVEISLSSFRNKNELYVISFIIDITSRKKQEDQINKAQEELELRVLDRTKELELVNNSLEKANRNLQEEMIERRKIEEALRDSERLFSTIARNFPDGIICVTNREFNIVFIDGKALDTMGVRRDTLKGKKTSALEVFNFNEADKAKLLKVFNWESTHIDVSLNDEHYIINAVPLPDAKGFIKEILLVLQNVTEVKKAEKEILLSLEKEKELNEMKSKFVSIASHEFRTPLSTILTSVSLIGKYDDNSLLDKRKKHIERIKGSVKNLTDILNDFLSLEKLEAGKVEIRFETINFRQFCEEITEEMQSVSKSGQQIILNYSGEPELVADKTLLRHILINLINNAIKYSPEDSKVDFMVENDNEIRITITDYGIGIPKDDQQHLFERFFRAANVTAIQGTGLGLNIVQRYVKKLNGTISVKSTENEGTTFKITLPKQ
ncbi:MAG: PAS domain-containing sensor histidine kinase [Bacteroidota bacterium]